MTFIYLNIVRLSWFLGATTLFMYDKIEIQKYFNRIGNPIIDSMSKALTHAGDGVFAIVVCITFLFIRLKTALLLFISFTVSAGIVQLLKHFVFSDMKRPYFSLRYDPDFRIIENLTYHTSHAFPSGHSASIFAICTVIAFQYQKKITWQILLALFAMLIGLTRVYLCQHFLQDVIAGSLIGTLIAYYCCILFKNKFDSINKPLRIR